MEAGGLAAMSQTPQGNANSMLDSLSGELDVPSFSKTPSWLAKTSSPALQLFDIQRSWLKYVAAATKVVAD